MTGDTALDGAGAATAEVPDLDWPLMRNNITREDLDGLIEYLQADDPRLTQGPQVRAFEAEWSEWLGVAHSVFVNSGSSANLLTLAALRELRGEGGEVIVPPLTWVSDVAAVLQNGFTPVFVDIDPRSLALDPQQTIDALTERTVAVFVTHVLGYDGLDDRVMAELKARRVALIEDVCESHGATHATLDGPRRCGSFGWASNFSFYYAHHMSTIEGGMICTDDAELASVLKMMRSHGMVRECGDAALAGRYHTGHPDLNPDFIFAFPAYNVRNTELGGVLGRTQLKRLDTDNSKRRVNLDRFLAGLDPARYRTDFLVEGSCNYAFTLVLAEADEGLRARVETTLRAARVEFRRGLSGGGNQLRQPYLIARHGPADLSRFPQVEHVHFNGWYIGNYPTLEGEKIDALCALLNSL